MSGLADQLPTVSRRAYAVQRSGLPLRLVHYSEHDHGDAAEALIVAAWILLFVPIPGARSKKRKMTEQLEAEIVELQTKLQFQEDALNKLDDVVIQQGDIIDRLSWKLKELEDKLEEVKYERGSAQDPGEEKPPHY